MERNLNNILVTILVTAIWIFSCVLIFVGFHGELNWVALTLFCLFTYASTMLWKTVFDRRVAPFALMFWLFQTNIFLLPALSQSIHRSFVRSSYSAYTVVSLLYACFIIAVGLFAFRIGVALGRRKARRHTFGVSGREIF